MGANREILSQRLELLPQVQVVVRLRVAVGAPQRVEPSVGGAQDGLGANLILNFIEQSTEIGRKRLKQWKMERFMEEKMTTTQ